MIAMECFHWMKNKKKDKKGTTRLKLHMSKAYDKIEWDFVLGALRVFEFTASMIPDLHLYLLCFLSVTCQWLA